MAKDKVKKQDKKEAKEYVLIDLFLYHYSTFEFIKVRKNRLKYEIRVKHLDRNGQGFRSVMVATKKELENIYKMISDKKLKWNCSSKAKNEKHLPILKEVIKSLD